jgi:hypothetical protein
MRTSYAICCAPAAHAVQAHVEAVVALLDDDVDSVGT